MKNTYIFIAILLLCSSTYAATGDVNNDGSVNILDINIILSDFGKTQNYNAGSDLAPPLGKIDLFDVMVVINNWGVHDVPHYSGSASIAIRHPYASGVQPSLTRKSFDLTFWIENAPANADHLTLTITEVSPKSTKIDILDTPYSVWKSTGEPYYETTTTCGDALSTVSVKDHFQKERIAVTNLAEGKYYKLLLDLKDSAGASIGIKAESCIEVNEELLNALPHVNSVAVRNSGGSVPAHLASLKTQAAQNPDAQPCPTHDPTKHHFIYDPVRKCHYDHEHKDDPNRDYYDTGGLNRYGTNRGSGDVLSVLGETWAWIGQSDKLKRHVSELPTYQTITFPWHTWSGLDLGMAPVAGKLENDLKHNGYAWMVRTPDDFASSRPDCDPNQPWYIKACITHFRFQLHAVAGMPDALTHTHSYFLEARVCTLDSNNGKDESKCGIYRGGGHLGFGKLGVNRWSITEPGQQEIMPIFYTDGHPSTLEQGGIRLHGGMSDDDVRASARDFTWYPEGRPSMVAIVASSFGPLLYVPKGVSYQTSRYSLVGPDVTNIRRMLYYCQDPTKCRWPNGGQMEAHFIIIRVEESWDGAYFDEDGKTNGFFSFTGYSDMQGNLVTDKSCDGKPLSPDCIPTIYDNVPAVIEAQHRDSSVGTPTYNYDLAPDGRYWIQFPN